MLRVAFVAALLTVCATVVTAQNLDVIKARKEALKAMGDAAKAPGAMLKGEAPFDLAKVHAALQIYQKSAAKLPDLFPEDSKTGGDTEALPAIWENKQDFATRYPKLAADAKAAEAAIKDEASFKKVWPVLMTENCRSCHEKYRVKK